MKSFLKQNLVLLIIALFSAAGLFGLSYLSLLNYSYDMEEQYITACNAETISELESSMKYGKSISSYYGISRLLDKAASLLRDNCILVIKDADGTDIASTETLQSFSVDTSEYGITEQEIFDKHGQTAGLLITYYPKSGIQADLNSAMVRSAVGSIVIICALFICYALLGALKKVSRQKLVYVIIAGIIVQGCFLTYNYAPQFKISAEKNVYGIAAYLKDTLDSITEKGIEIEEINDLDSYLSEKQQSYEWISSIKIVNNDPVSDDDTYVLSLGDGNSDMALQIGISSGYIQWNVTEMVLTFIATIIIAVVIMKESLSLSDIIAFKKSGMFGKRCSEQFSDVAKTLRYSKFMSSTFSYICLSFAALQIKEWNAGFWGISPEMAAAASISICSIAEAAGMLIMPVITRKLSARTLNTISKLLLITANFACFFTNSALIIIAMRFLAGIGFACNEQIMNMLISMGYDTEEQKSANLAAGNYGVIGGILCGMGLGSIIAGVFGYSATFLAAGVGCVLYLIFSDRCVPWVVLVRSKRNEKKHDIKKIFRAFISPSVWRSIILVVMPQYFFLMVIVALIPGRIQSGGFSPVVLTYANLLNGIFGLYVGEYLGRFLTKRFKLHRSLALMFAAGTAGMLILELSAVPTLMILISAVIMGFVDGVGTPLAADIFLSSKQLTGAVGEDSALMVYSVIGYIVMSIAPVILELCVGSAGVMYASCAVLGVIALILFISREKERQNK